ncbi:MULTISPECIES: aspartate/glutamate racemase family protein [Streptomycetaceae]|uniref:Aspartate racemase subfamily n=1 Tax=Streptantibioticus cattleyicolor (strain ATCC 35852 / DSM 46488 / JCM 4925 / NBRC 14057 / NRRL 8057) TaxID=1003195 RepID=F8K3C2_STREN|nr:amino acid racemase [Streptantibioticus cattleyicolor]AEW95034.1 aspartate racemase subfamily [Streptantibioticus cattleyicolor NRRL 8057 = DSM 46488]MYS59633.1 amino acid racemase [Streptomyces sp. SID5468]CCB75386.1 putative Aspartate racemase [Streptantibioticus cattleyicolor NRRL 8057 = DSM 46488]
MSAGYTSPRVLGVLGGMGPLASAEFVRTLYACQPAGPDQSRPRVLLDSDPAFPDRTEAIRTGRTAEMTGRLELRLAELLDRGADQLVVVCYTAHHFLALVDPALRARLVSLVEVTAAQLLRTTGRFLLLATEGTRRAGIFDRAPGWADVAHRVVLPAPADQERVHRLIYRMKTYGPLPDEALPLVEELRQAYDCAGVVLGCTEFHLVSDRLTARYGPARTVDALRTVATRFPAAPDAYADPPLAAPGRVPQVTPV